MPHPTYTSSDTGHRSVGGDTHADIPIPNPSAVSWGAIVAGAAAAAALSLILLVLGTGLGLSSVSPWTHSGISATGFGISTILWLTLTQLLASGMGGYLAGRLRTRWTNVHSDEVYFRDTAHGFLAWAVASLATAALLTGVITSIVGGGVQAGATAAGGAAKAGAGLAATLAGTQDAADGRSDSTGYFVDTLFRRDAGSSAVPPAAGASGSDPAALERSATASVSESTRIFMSAMNTAGPLPPEDVRHLGQMVAQRTGLGQAEAEKRVTDTYTRMQTRLRDAELAARAAADKARKASAYAALWLFVALLIGAFVASFSATLGGRQRDA